MYKEKFKPTKSSDLFSLNPKSKTLNNQKTKTVLKTGLKQKKIIKLYLIEDKYYIEHSTAYSLGLVSTRAIMLNKPKLVEISSLIHKSLEEDETIEIEYIYEKEQKIEDNEASNENKAPTSSFSNKMRKQPIKVFYENDKYYIENSAAYALGLISVKSFNESVKGYYPINNEILKKLQSSYDVEMYPLNQEEVQMSK